METAQLKNARLLRLGCFLVFPVAISLAPIWRAQACDSEKRTTETHFVLDPEKRKFSLNSGRDNSATEVVHCTGANEKFLKISLAPLIYEYSTLAKENYSNNPDFVTNRCSLSSEIPMAALPDYDIRKFSGEKFSALRTCFAVQVNEKAGRTIIFDEIQPDCKVTALDGAKSSLLLEGNYCFLSAHPQYIYDMKPVLKPDCLKADFLKQNHISAQDIEARLLVWSLSKKSNFDASVEVVSKRDLRVTILPPARSLPVASRAQDSNFAFSSVLSTDIHQGPINLRPLGLKKVQVASGYMVQNLSAAICKDDFCLRNSNFIAPIAGRGEIFKISEKGERKSLARWDFPMQMPSNWIGLAIPPVSSFLGRANPFVTVGEKFNPGDTYEIVSKFYEPRTYLEEMASSMALREYESGTGSDESSDGIAFPEFPKMQMMEAFAQFPSFDWTAGPDAGTVDLKKEWSHFYDRVCDSENKKCQTLRGLAKPFAELTTRFRIGKTNASGVYELTDIHVARRSATFATYEQALTHLPEVRCQ